MPIFEGKKSTSISEEGQGGKEDTKLTFVDEEADGGRFRTLLAVNSVSKGVLTVTVQGCCREHLQKITNQMVITILESLSVPQQNPSSVSLLYDLV